MPSLSVLKAAFRFRQTHGDRRDWRSPAGLSLEQKGGLMFCDKCGTTYLVNHINLFASCEACGGPLTIEKKVDHKNSAEAEKKRRIS